MAVSLNDLYSKLGCLHKGNAASIWQVRDNINGNIYVLKEIKRTGLPYHQLKEINSTIIPKVVYESEERGITYVVEEYIQGKTLSEVMEKKGPFSDDEVIEIGASLCDGLKLLHQKNIIHRDLKPSNVMLTNDGNVKLIDFDASRIYKKKQTQDTCFIGTVSFAPPELLNEGQTNQQSDIYSLGVTFKAMLPQGYKGKLSEIISKCTQYDVSQRYKSVEKLKAELESKRSRPFPFKKLLIGLIFICGAGVATAMSGNTIFTDDLPQKTSIQNEDNTISSSDTSLKDEINQQMEVDADAESNTITYKKFFDNYYGYSFDYPDIQSSRLPNKNSVQPQRQNYRKFKWDYNDSAEIIIDIEYMHSGEAERIKNWSSFTTEEMLEAYKICKYGQYKVTSIKIIGEHAIERELRHDITKNDTEYMIERIFLGEPGRSDIASYDPNPQLPAVYGQKIYVRYRTRLTKKGQDVWKRMSESFKPGLIL